MGTDLMDRLADAGDLLDRWADSSQRATVGRSTAGDDNDRRDGEAVQFLEVDLAPASPEPARRRRYVVAGGIAAAVMLIAGLVALATTGGNNTGVASGGEIVALVPDGGVQPTQVREGPVTYVTDDIQGPISEDRIAETGNEREVRWEVEGGMAWVTSRSIPEPALAEQIIGPIGGVDQTVRGRNGHRIDVSNTLSMAPTVVILRWEESPGLYVNLSVDTTRPDPVRAALEIAENLVALDEDQWKARYGTVLDLQRLQQEDAARDEARRMQELAEARFLDDPRLKEVHGTLHDGTDFEIVTLDFAIYCETLDGVDEGCSPASILDLGGETPRQLAPSPTMLGVDDGNRMTLLYGSLGQTATDVVATDDAGEPTTAGPLVSDGLWALPLAHNERSGSLVFLDADGDEVHRMHW